MRQKAVIYWYVSREKGAPRFAVFRGATFTDSLLAEREGAHELPALFQAAKSGWGRPSISSLAGVLDAYERSDAFKRRAASTNTEWSRILAELQRHKLGQMPTAALAARRAPAAFQDAQAAWVREKGPRAADYRIQVLRTALAWAVLRGDAPANPAARVPAVWTSDRSDTIWTKEDETRFAAVAPAPVLLALQLACATGLRREDLVTLSPSQIGPHAITLQPRKSARRAKTAGKKARTAVVPLTDEARAVLAQCDLKGLRVLTNSKGRPWTPDGLTSSFIKARDAAGIVDAETGRPKTLHDCRGTFATRLAAAGFTADEIADVLGWELRAVRDIIRRYVSDDALALAQIERLRRRPKV